MKQSKGPQRRRLTDERRDQLAQAWPIVPRIIQDQWRQGRIKYRNLDIAYAMASTLMMSAAGRWQPGDPSGAKLTTFLWNTLTRYLPAKVRDSVKYEITHPNGISIERHDRRERFVRHKNVLGRAKTTSVHERKYAPDKRRGPAEEAESNEEVARITRIMAECDAAMPEHMGYLRRQMSGELVQDMAREKGCSGPAISSMIFTARKWLAWRIYGDANYQKVPNGRAKVSQ